jgi:hypothetical protein
VSKRLETFEALRELAEDIQVFGQGSLGKIPRFVQLLEIGHLELDEEVLFSEEALLRRKGSVEGRKTSNALDALARDAASKAGSFVRVGRPELRPIRWQESCTPPFAQFPETRDLEV